MKVAALLTVVVLVVAACGGGDSGGESDADQSATPQTQTTQQPGGDDDSRDQGADDSSADTAGPAEINTIVVGSEVWVRQLPMTEGQCFLPAEGGGDPTNGTVWGPVEGDGIRFSVSYAGEGSGNSHEAEVEGPDFWWAAGERVGTDDLVVEVDHDTRTISGNGTFVSQLTGEREFGSFAFQCEPDG